MGKGADDWHWAQEERRKEREHQEFLKRQEQVEADRASGRLDQLAKEAKARNRKTFGEVIWVGVVTVAVFAFVLSLGHYGAWW